MQETKKILNWFFTPASFIKKADFVVSSQAKQKLKKAEKILNEISLSSLDDSLSIDPILIEEVYEKFWTNVELETPELANLFTRRESRLLIATIDFIGGYEQILEADAFQKAMDVINLNWKDSFIISFFNLILINWSDLIKNEKNRKILFKSLISRCNNYSGKRTEILNVKKFIKDFEKKNAPRIYASKMSEFQTSMDKAHVLIYKKEVVLGFDFFGEVVKYYVSGIEKNQITKNKLIGVYNFLRLHNSKKVSLLICSEIINHRKFDAFQEVLKTNTLEIIGDPIKPSKWKYAGLSEQQNANVEKARIKLNMLLNKQLIKIFFEKLVVDQRRKVFWLKKINEIGEIKFCGNRANHYTLKNTEEVSAQVNSRYKIMQSRSQTCSMIMYSKGFVFVEFSDTGALYIYKERNFNVNLNDIDRIEELKIWPTSKMACKNSSYSGYLDLQEEGRITHAGNWENRLNFWMREYYD